MAGFTFHKQNVFGKLLNIVLIIRIVKDINQAMAFTEHYQYPIRISPQQVQKNIRNLGGAHGYYFAPVLWKLRGAIDKLLGGIGNGSHRLQNADRLSVGDQLGLWVVKAVELEPYRVQLKPLAKLPGEVVLTFDIVQFNGEYHLIMKNSFQPSGLWGRIYWYLSLPLHQWIFRGMARNISRFDKG